MKCVGYNVDFQRDLAAKIPFFVPKPRKKSAKKVVAPKPKAKTSQKRGVVSAPRGQKRKREEPENASDADEENSDVPDPESEEEEDYREIVYRPRGTRSRPIVL